MHSTAQSEVANRRRNTPVSQIDASGPDHDSADAYYVDGEELASSDHSSSRIA